LREAGFEAQFSSARLGRGLHQMRLIVVDANGQTARSTRFSVPIEIL
jgi:hypothetical protein